MLVYTVTGKQLQLVEPPLNSGGEGKIYKIKGYTGKLVKIYHSIPQAAKRKGKVHRMAELSRTCGFASSHLGDYVSWPLSEIYNQKQEFIGFGMNLMPSGNPLNTIYSYTPGVKSHYSLGDRLKVLINLCNVMGSIHSLGQCIGDGNPDNIIVDNKLNVFYLDADSFHIKSQGNTYRCIACAPGYAAPEVMKAVKGYNYENCPGRTFSIESDNFALAVHIFCALMNGAHPYSSCVISNSSGSTPPGLSIDNAIEIGFSSFFKRKAGYGIPRYAPSISSLPPYIIALFKRAFVDGSSTPSSRPGWREWKAALLKFSGELRRCLAGHMYWNGSASCPYCRVEKKMNMLSKPGPRPAAAGNAHIPVQPFHSPAPQGNSPAVVVGTCRQGHPVSPTPVARPAAANVSTRPAVSASGGSSISSEVFRILSIGLNMFLMACLCELPLLSFLVSYCSSTFIFIDPDMCSIICFAWAMVRCYRYGSKCAMRLSDVAISVLKALEGIPMGFLVCGFINLVINLIS